MIVIPILSHVLPVSTVPAALSIGTATNSVSRLAPFCRRIRWDIVRHFVPASQYPQCGWELGCCSTAFRMYLELMMDAGNSRRVRRSRVKRGGPVRSRIPRSICAVPRDGGCLRSSGLWKTFSTDSSGWPRLNLRRHKHAPATSRWTLICICTRFRRQRFYVHNRLHASTDNLIRKR